MRPFTHRHLRPEARSRARGRDAERLPRARPRRAGRPDRPEREHPGASGASEQHRAGRDEPRELATRSARTGGCPRPPVRATRGGRQDGRRGRHAERQQREPTPRAALRRAPSRRRSRRTPVRWARNGGLTTFLFAAADPAHLRRVLVVPDRADGDHVDAGDEPRRRADVGRPRQLPHRHRGPAAADGDQEHGVLRRSRADLRLPDPARRGGADERGPAVPRCLRRARVPPRRHPAGRRRPALEDVLRRQLERRLQHDSRLGRPRPLPMAAVAEHGDAVARARGDVGQRRSDRHHLPRRADERQQRALRGGVGRRRGALAQGLAHHAAAAPRRAARDDDPADHRDGAGLPRAVPVHLGRARTTRR